MDVGPESSLGPSGIDLTAGYIFDIVNKGNSYVPGAGAGAPQMHRNEDVYKRQAIGITEVLYFAKSAVNRDVNALAYLVAAGFYLIMTYGLTVLFRRLERKYNY